MKRRELLQLSAAGMLAAMAAPQTAFARAETDARLVLVILRGGLDGLHTLIPYADRDYRRLRPTLAVKAPGNDQGALKLDGYFGLHRGLAPLLPLYQRGELLLIPAASTRYRQRSHFDGQNLLENGSGVPYGATDGWLNRALAGLHAGDTRLGLALGPTIPLILQGRAGVQTWSETGLPAVDDDFLARLAQVYSEDTLFRDTLSAARGAMQPRLSGSNDSRNPLRGPDFGRAAAVAADLLSRDNGPRIAAMEMQGWDTHFDQERRLHRLFEELAGGLLALRSGLGASWGKTAVVVVSEFGRTAAQNASRGTDHGTGGLAMLLGGAVRGGRIEGEWPGLGSRALYEGRDLRAVNPYESLFKALLIGHLGVAEHIVEDDVFPHSRSVMPWDGLLRSG